MYTSLSRSCFLLFLCQRSTCMVLYLEQILLDPLKHLLDSPILLFGEQRCILLKLGGLFRRQVCLDTNALSYAPNPFFIENPIRGYVRRPAHDNYYIRSYAHQRPNNPTDCFMLYILSDFGWTITGYGNNSFLLLTHGCYILDRLYHHGTRDPDIAPSPVLWPLPLLISRLGKFCEIPNTRAVAHVRTRNGSRWFSHDNNP